MSPTGVGFAFAFLVFAREIHHLYRPWQKRRREAKAECERHGHTWGEPFVAMGTRIRPCTRCKKQEHWSADADEWR